MAQWVKNKKLIIENISDMFIENYSLLWYSNIGSTTSKK